MESPTDVESPPTTESSTTMRSQSPTTMESPSNAESLPTMESSATMRSQSPTTTEYSTTTGSSNMTGSSITTETPSLMAIERPVLLEESRTQCRYFVFFDDIESQFHAYLVCPDTGVYRFKLVKLHVKLSAQFPEVPPKVRFLHHTRHHIHPNFFVSGRLCLSLFGDFDHHTWKSQVGQWEPGKICHNMLLYLRELLDDNPFKREPCGQDKPELNHFVQYVTWDALLLRYIASETQVDALAWLREHLRLRGVDMLCELLKQRAADPGRKFFINLSHQRIPADYLALFKELGAAVSRARLPARSFTAPAGVVSSDLELADEAAWTWAGRVSLKWTLAFSGHPHQYF